MWYDTPMGAEGIPFEPRTKSDASKQQRSGKSHEKEQVASRIFSSTVKDPDIFFSYDSCSMGLPRSFHGSRESSHPASDLLVGPSPFLNMEAKGWDGSWMDGRIASPFNPPMRFQIHLFKPVIPNWDG